MNSSHWIGWFALSVTAGSVLFSVGHWFGRHEELHRQEARKRKEESTSYYRGLNFLLSDEPDKAIEEFIKAARVNSDTVEIYLSLGNLFRTRGEVGRAIRIHQTIIARPNLPPSVRTAALFAMAEDYRQGGFVDRAVEAYEQVLKVEPDHQKALAGLQILHETDERWAQALDILSRLEKVSSKPDPRRKAHLLVQLGLEALHGDQPPQPNQAATDYFRAAIQVYPGCVEAYRLLGEEQMLAGNPRQAIKIFLDLQQNRPSHLVFLFDAVEKAYAELDEPNGLEIFMTAVSSSPLVSSGLLLRWSAWLEQRNRLDDAIHMLREGLRHRPNVTVLAYQLITLLQRRNHPQEAILVATLHLEQLLDRQYHFQCAHCGFKSRDVYWKCPQCHQWDLMEPL